MPHTKVRELAEHLLGYLNASPTAFHAVANAAAMLRDGGFAELSESEPWILEPGGKYFIMRNHSAVVAFAVGAGDPAAHGFRVVGAHTDFPGFKVKPGCCIATADGHVKLNTETYGGVILSSWFDRPLGLAGRVVLKSAGFLRPRERLFDAGKPMAIIPNLCIHFNRQVNEGYAYNKQVDMLPLFAMTAGGRGGADCLPDLLAGVLEVAPDEIADYDLFLYESAPGVAMGEGLEFISASRVDNLASVFAGLTGLLQSDANPGIRVLAAFDNEEVGSNTAQGAAGGLLPGLLRRICFSLGMDEEGYWRALANSLAVSADAAHAVHPNHPEAHDPENRPALGGGPAIKFSAAQKYATSAVTAAVFRRVCEAAGVPCQSYVNRSDIPGGSTIGPALAAGCGIATVDVGIPILAMHSVRELACVADTLYFIRALREFYGSTDALA